MKLADTHERLAEARLALQRIAEAIEGAEYGLLRRHEHEIVDQLVSLGFAEIDDDDIVVIPKS